MVVKTRAIVISSIKYQEKSLIVKCFTLSDGLKSYFVRDAFSSRKSNQKIAYFQPFSLLEIEAVHKNKGTLENFKEILKQKRETDRGRLPWYSLHWARKKEIFEGEKIICPQRATTVSFSYNNIPWYASADVYFITQKKSQNDNMVELKYVLALLNSKLYYHWFYHRGKRKGEMLELYQKPLSEVPIKIIQP